MIKGEPVYSGQYIQGQSSGGILGGQLQGLSIVDAEKISSLLVLNFLSLLNNTHWQHSGCVISMQSLGSYNVVSLYYLSIIYPHFKSD